MPALQNHIVWSISKTFNLELTVLLIPHKAPNLSSVGCAESITVSITNKALLLNEKGSYNFMFSLKIVTFYWKKTLLLIMLSNS